MRNNHHDIGLIRLENKVTFTPYIRPVCFPLKESSLTGLNLTVAGWGRTYFNDRTTPKSLRKTHVTVIANRDCKENTMWRVRKQHSIEHHMFCAKGSIAHQHKHAPRRDACLGDSGG